MDRLDVKHSSADFLYFYAMNISGIRLLIIAFVVSLVCNGKSLATNPPNKTFVTAFPSFSQSLAFHNDSIHQLNFKYADRKRGIKPFIAPVILIGTGTALHFSDAKYDFNNWIQGNFPYSGKLEDYLQYAPVVAVYGLNMMGVKGKNNYGNLTAITIKSFLLNDLITYTLKRKVDATRPSGGPHSFPSGHTSFVFAMAQIVHHEFGEQSIWFSVGAYSCATAVGIMRMEKGAHWISDVLAGAGIGMFSTELVYLTHQYKWDWEHVKNFDVFPWSAGPQKGLTLVYTF